MTDTIEQAQQFLLKGDFSASLSMYRRIYDESEKNEDRGTAAGMLSQMYACGMTGEVNDKLADDFLAKAVKLQSPLGLFLVESKDPDISSAEFEKLVKKLKRLADEGNTFAMIEMGLMYEHGHHRRVNLKKALEWYEKAASLGHADAMVRAGWIWEDGNFKGHDDHKAFLWYLKSAAMAYGNGECQLGCCYRDGIGTGRDIRRALICLEKGADHGSAEAALLLSEIYSGEGAEDEEERSLADREKSFSYLKLAAENGGDEALMRLGNMYYRGEGTEKNQEKAEQCYKKAWDGGNPLAGTMLGLIYIYGYGDPESMKKGISYLYQASREGDPDAFRELALCLLYGRGMEKNETRGLSMLESLTEENEPLSLTALGNWYMNRREPDKALPYFRKASDLGEPNAEFALGYCYLSGTAVPRNLRKAQELLQRAAMKGQKEAEKELRTHFG
ncbi:tetratricopeptide repeat protein [uncultured Dialister sp.]|uniref:tetratricopeptide repeat protein n=1 Tax=uncultured Dialister sp. TaxID=278064 RepID=UPI00261B70CD|nr:tetratricopeptide repeat protein [uncultured Dialister sp.]